MAITEEQARELARAHIDRHDGPEVAINDRETISRDWGWVFFYNAPAFNETGDWRHQIPGCGPVFVSKLDGSIEEPGTSRPFEIALAEYEARLGDGG